MRVGPNIATVDLWLYLREKTVRRINRHRTPERRLSFRSKYRIALEQSAQVRTYGDILRRHREEHGEDWLRGVVQMAIETGDAEAVLKRFLRQGM